MFKGLFKKKAKADQEDLSADLPDLDVEGEAPEADLPASAEPQGDGSLEDIVRSTIDDVSFDGEHLLQIGKKSVAIGMLWEGLLDDTTPKQQAADLSNQKITYDLFANFKAAGQVGFSARTKKLKIGTKAGVTSVDDKKMGQSWVAAFRLGEQSGYWWVAAHRNGQVYEDQILSSEEDARMVFLENLQAPDWERQIAPEEWGIAGALPYDVQDIIDPLLGIPLKPTNIIKAYLSRIIASVVIVSVMIAGFLFYQDYVEKQRILEEQLKRQREAIVSVSPSDYPWFDTPALIPFFEKCRIEMAKSIRLVPGWYQEAVSCDMSLTDKKAVISTSWLSTAGGTVPWLVSAFPPGEAQPSVSQDGLQARYGSTLEFGVQTEVLDEPWERMKIDSVLSRRLQTTGVKLNLVANVTRLTPSQQATTKEPIFNYHEVSFEASAGLEEYAKLLSDIPAIVPVGMTYNIDGRSFFVTFRIYHPAILPGPGASSG